MKILKNAPKGFTLIEILVVIALIAILAAVTFVAIDPVKNFQDARNATRQTHVVALLDSITRYLADGNSISSLESSASTTLATCGDATTPYKNIGTGSGNVNLAPALVDTYIGSIPQDPSNGTDANTGYQICKTANGRITVNAPGAERNKVIKQTR